MILLTSQEQFEQYYNKDKDLYYFTEPIQIIFDIHCSKTIYSTENIQIGRYYWDSGYIGYDSLIDLPLAYSFNCDVISEKNIIIRSTVTCGGKMIANGYITDVKNICSSKVFQGKYNKYMFKKLNT